MGNLTSRELGKRGNGYKLSPETVAMINNAQDRAMIGLTYHQDANDETDHVIVDTANKPMSYDDKPLTVAVCRDLVDQIVSALENGGIAADVRSDLIHARTEYKRALWDGLLQIRDKEIHRVEIALTAFKAGWTYTVGNVREVVGMQRFDEDKGDPDLTFGVQCFKRKDTASSTIAALNIAKAAQSKVIVKPASGVERPAVMPNASVSASK